jgi:hypothetical protein
LQMVNKNFVIHSAWMLPLKKNIFFFLLFWKPNITLIPPFGQPLTIQPNLSLGLLFCKSDRTCTSNAIYQIHARNTSIWTQPWAPIWENIHDHLLLPVVNTPLPSKVADLWI